MHNTKISNLKKKELFPMIIKDNGTEITNKLNITNIINTYFTGIGSNLAKIIHYSGDRYYFKNAQHENFKFKEIDEETIKRTINKSPKEK